MQRKRQVTSARQAAISPLVRVDRDQGIEKNLDAAPVQNTMRDNVKYNVKNAVLPLIGEVIAQALRSESASRLPTHHRPPGRVRRQGHFLQPDTLVSSTRFTIEKTTRVMNARISRGRKTNSRACLLYTSPSPRD